MKTFYTGLLLFFGLCANTFAHTTTLEIDSFTQARQYVTLQRCDTLIVRDFTGQVVYLCKDTFANGLANLTQLINASYTNSPTYTTKWYNLGNLPSLYLTHTSGVVYFVISFEAHCGPPPCSAGISYTHDTTGYTFTPVQLAWDSNSTNYIWTLNGDTLTNDTATYQSHFAPDTLGTYQVCLHTSDSAEACAVYTCLSVIYDTTYTPMLDSINIWHMFISICAVEAAQNHGSRTNTCNYPTWYYNSPIYFTQGDTLVDSLNYKVLYYGSSVQSYGFCFYGLIREDTAARKVYFKDNTGNPEVILYDFSLQQGDSINVHFVNQNGYFPNGYYRVDSIGRKFINGISRRVFYLKVPWVTYQGRLIWVEGIGNLGDPVYSYSVYYGFGCSMVNDCNTGNGGASFPYDYSSYVTCFEHSQKVYFDSCAYSQISHSFCIAQLDTCDYYNICGAIHELFSLSSFTLSPNPASDYAVLDLDIKQGDNFTVVVQDLNGKNVLAETNLGWLPAGIQHKTIRVTNLSSGIYLIGCRTAEGTVYRKLVVQKL